MKFIIAGLLVTLILFCGTGCIKNRNNMSVTQTESEKSQEFEMVNPDSNIPMQDTRSEKEKARDAIVAWVLAKYSWTIEFIHLEKVDFGIPRGENWITRFKRPRPDGELIESNFLFLIANGEVNKDFSLGPDEDLSRKVEIQYDIMQYIPGIRLGNGASAYEDYNGDGVFELFTYIFGGWANLVSIKGYDKEAGKVINYCDIDIPFGIIDPVNGPAPVEFINYNGQYGFKVYFMANTVAGGPTYKPEPIPDNGKWFFYTFDEAERKYMRVGEITE